MHFLNNETMRQEQKNKKEFNRYNIFDATIYNVL